VPSERYASTVPPRRVLKRLSLAGLTLVLATNAFADGPILHEFIPADPEEDLELRATTPDGRMPAAIETPSGVVGAPTERRDEPQVAYGGNATPDSIDSSYRLDRDTTRPNSVSYDDPFIPSVMPFKRLYAYDAVDESMELVVADKRRKRLEIGGTAAPGEDQFYGDLFVDVVPGVPVRIPSVGAGARVLAARVEPASPFELVRDGADNWFLLGTERKRVRLILQLSIARSVFGSAYPDVGWATVEKQLPSVPPAVKDVAKDVIYALGLSTNVKPRDALTTLVGYFRGFAPSEDVPQARASLELYREIALSKKGVCRHRSYAFVVTALGLGLPARLVRNEAHAWVEVGDGSVFHRIDLGGAASRFEIDDASARVTPHAPPDDPYAWPEGSESASAALEASGARTAGRQPEAGNPSNPRSPRAPAPSSSVSRASSSLSSSPDDPAAPNTTSDRPATEVTVTLSTPEIRRGHLIGVRGTASADDDPCPFARVDLSLRSSAGQTLFLASLPTDEKGRFEADLTVPLHADVGNYELVGTTPGSGNCGASRSGAP
jgi:hypothetical protein